MKSYGIPKISSPGSLVFFVCILWGVFMFFPFVGFAETDLPQARIHFTSSPNPVGSGARALGMGGAFIGVCDDATAASWNPAGLVQLEKPEFSIVYAYHKNSTDSDYGAFQDASSSQGASSGSLNYLSAVYPFVFWGRNMTASINYQHLYDFSDEGAWRYVDTSSLSLIETNTKYSLEGQLWAISPAFSVQVTPALSLGFTLNFWEDGFYDNEWESHYKKTNEHIVLFSGEKKVLRTTHTERFAFSGVNFHVGLLWNVNQYLTIGGVFKAPFEADIKYRYDFTANSYNAQESQDPEELEQEREKEIIKTTSLSNDQTLDMPLSYGLGAGIRVSDALSFSLDVYRTHWKDYILHGSSGEATSPISGIRESESGVDNTTQVRLGSEYLIIRDKFIVPLRCGFFYDPEPSMDGTDEFWGMSLGTGITWKRFVFDTAFQYRFGNDIRSTIQDEDRWQDKKTYTLYTSLIFYF